MCVFKVSIYFLQSSALIMVLTLLISVLHLRKKSTMYTERDEAVCRLNTSATSYTNFK